MTTDTVWLWMSQYDNTLIQVNLDFDRDQPALLAIREKRDPRPDELPVVIFGGFPDAPVRKLPPLFDGGGAWTFSAQLAAPLLKLDLGKTLILPVRILQNDKKTEIFADRGYFQMLRHEVFNALAPEESQNLKQSRYSNTHWSVPIDRELKDDDVAVHATALDAPNIWHDPQLMNSMFFSGKAVAALRDAGVSKYFAFIQCRIVE